LRLFSWSRRLSGLRSNPTKNSGLLPRGYYLLFLVTNERVPSHGVWVKVQ
jgi:hypothetical protein